MLFLIFRWNLSISERVFSCGDRIVTAKSTKLMPENVDMLVYVRQYFDKVKTQSTSFILKIQASSQSRTGPEDDD